MTAFAPHLPLFCFGSLMEPSVLAAVTDQDPETLRIERAVARDHLQREVVGESFPILIESAGERAEGRLVHGLDERALERVLFFEGEEYALAPLEVEVDGDVRAARFFRDTGVYATTGRAWDFERWRRGDIDTFLQYTRRYMALHGRMTVAEADAFWNERGDG